MESLLLGWLEWYDLVRLWVVGVIFTLVFALGINADDEGEEPEPFTGAKLAFAVICALLWPLFLVGAARFRTRSERQAHVRDLKP